MNVRRLARASRLVKYLSDACVSDVPLRDSCRLHRRIFGLVNELAAHPLRCERIGVNISPRLLVADAVGTFFVLLFLSLTTITW